VGLSYPRSATELRTAIADGSIANIVHWQPVHKGDVILIPAGTIHAIGPGIVLAEIQQHSDATFRMFDYGRQRELHIENAVAAATAGPREHQSPPERLSDARMALTVNPHFALEQIDLIPGSVWTLDAARETWILAIEGQAQLGVTTLSPGNAAFVEADRAVIEVGADGLKALLAYPGPNVNIDALRPRNVTAADRLRHEASRAPLVSTSLELAALKQSETPTWPL
jgi:mannose-6-phosphate isomerase